MAMNTLLLRPFDKLFVKDGRPLSLEDDSAASGLFPPPPSVLYGALRSGALAQTPDPIAAIGSQLDPANSGWRITGFALSHSYPTIANTDLKRPLLPQLYFPAPQDLIRPKSKGGADRSGSLSRRLQLDRSDATAHSSSPMPCSLTPGLGDRVEGVGGYLNGNGLAAYLRGESVDARDVFEASDLYEVEPKLGIGLDYHSGTTKDGLLYTMAMQRLKPGVQLAVQTQAFNEAPSLLRLGAEARAVEVTPGNDISWPTSGANTDGIFTLYLATPAVFRQGWLPDFLDPNSLTGSFGGATVRLLAAGIGRYVPLGGWDIQRRRPKPMRRAVPAGSVYHFELVDGRLEATGVHGSALASGFDDAEALENSDLPSYQQQGFGIAYLGAGPKTLDPNPAN